MRLTYCHTRLTVLAGAILATALTVFSGCATMSSSRSPGVDLTKIKKIYVIKLSADGRGINRVIADQLNLMGYQTTTGLETDVPQGVDATITYQNRWMWDITMYMLKLNVQIRDHKTGFLLAEGESYRLSLQRKSPEEMAKEVLESLFTTSQQH
jgi:hypothetical protein